MGGNEMLIEKEKEIWLVTKKNLFCSIKITPIMKDISYPTEWIKMKCIKCLCGVRKLNHTMNLNGRCLSVHHHGSCRVTERKSLKFWVKVSRTIHDNQSCIMESNCVPQRLCKRERWWQLKQWDKVFIFLFSG